MSSWFPLRYRVFGIFRKTSQNVRRTSAQVHAYLSLEQRQLLAADLLSWSSNAGQEITSPVSSTPEIAASAALDPVDDFLDNKSLEKNINATIGPLSMQNGVIEGRYVAYNNSAFSASGLGDAIAQDKSALLPGETATFENYTSYVRGINGLVIDINADNPENIGVDDFAFRFGNQDNVSNWDVVSPQFTVTVLPSGGENVDCPHFLYQQL